MKKILKCAFVAAFVAIAGYGVFTNQTSNVMSNLALANVEALADSEGSSDCETYCMYDRRYTCFLSWGAGTDGITCTEHRIRR